MYNTDFECRYHREDVFLDTDEITEKEREIVRNILYKEDLLNILLIDFSDDVDVFTATMNELYERVHQCAPLRECMATAAHDIAMSSDLQFGLCILYSFDYLYLSHVCVSEYLETGQVGEKSLEALKTALQRN